MEKRGLFLFLLILLILISLSIVYSQKSGGVSTGLIIIDTQGPKINLIEPLNNSGDADGNITFFYNVSDASDLHNCSLIINNKINLTNESTIKKNTKLNFTLNNTALGIYNWSINCTDNLGFVSVTENRTFTVIFMKNFNGTTTNISLVNITNVTNFVVEVTTAGLINFSVGIDLSQGLDLDKYINITSNRIELNSTAINALNKSATLYLYNLTFTDPRVLRDGAVCPSDICTEVSYSKGTFVFNVTHFTVYSSEETPSTTTTTTTTTTGGGGGGGGGGRAPVAVERDFTLSREILKVILKQGQTKEESFSIKNTGDVSLDITTYLQTLRELIVSPSLDVINILLNPDEEQTQILIFGAREDQKPDVYTGEIKVKSGTTEKIINIIVEVESIQPLFDVDVEVLPEFKNVLPGDELLYQEIHHRYF